MDWNQESKFTLSLPGWFLREILGVLDSRPVRLVQRVRWTRKMSFRRNWLVCDNLSEHALGGAHTPSLWNTKLFTHEFHFWVGISGGVHRWILFIRITFQLVSLSATGAHRNSHMTLITLFPRLMYSTIRRRPGWWLNTAALSETHCLILQPLYQIHSVPGLNRPPTQCRCGRASGTASFLD